jgi:perosamine synthetase
MIPITKPFTGDEEVELASEVIRSGWLTQGPKTAAFEMALAEYLGAKHVVAVSSCTTALHLAVILAGLVPGDEVIVPSYTFVATANALLYAGVKPVFAEIDPFTFNLDPQKLSQALTPRTKAVLVVDQFGLPADLDGIESFCQTHHLRLIEDAACALGARYKNRKIGSRGKFTTFSFHPRKSITTGEGGALVTDDAAVAERARLLRSHGASVTDVERHKTKGVTFEAYTELGYNYRLSDVQAAIGLAQLRRLDTILERRRSLAQRYDEKLKSLGWIDPPAIPSWAVHPYQTYAALLKRDAPENRNSLIQKLADKGVSSRRGIPPIHSEPYMKKRLDHPVSLPVTDDVSQRTLILPLYPQMTEAEQDQVLDALKSSALHS